MRRMIPDLRNQFKQEEEKAQIKNMRLAMAGARRRDHDSYNGITRKHFRDIDHFIEMEIPKHVARSQRYSVLMKSQYIESQLLSLGRTANGSDQVKGSNNITNTNTNTSKSKLNSNGSNKSKT